MIYSYLKDSAFTVVKGMYRCKLARYIKGAPFVSSRCKKGSGAGSGAQSLREKNVG